MVYKEVASTPGHGEENNEYPISSTEAILVYEDKGKPNILLEEVSRKPTPKHTKKVHPSRYNALPIGKKYFSEVSWQ